MRKLCLIVTIATMMLGCVLVQAQERQYLRANIPFSFMAQDTMFPAGSYTVHILNPFNGVRIESADGKHAAIIQGVMPDEGLKRAQRSELIFRRISGEYFLAQFHEQDSRVERSVPLGSRAKELARNRSLQQMATAVAAH